jgi:plastocyanin
MTKLSHYFSLSLLLGLGLSFLLPQSSALSANPTTELSSGSLIRGVAYPSVYYLGADGLRYVFPNEKTYFTWYDNFNSVTQISDEALGQIQIGGNVTYKPGVKMVKINTDPKTYAVAPGGYLHWIENETLAGTIFGGDWANKIDDLPDAFFTNYHIGSSLNNASSYQLNNVRIATADVNQDKNLSVPAIFTITNTGYSPIDFHIPLGKSVRFVNADTVQHTATADDLSWGSGTLAPNAQFVHTFSTIGTYQFFDSYNSRHTGAVYVTAK